MSVYLVFGAIALGSWLLRVCFIALLPAHRLPAGFRQSLEHLAPAVLAAVVALDLSAGVRQATTGTGIAVVLGATIGIALIVWRFRSSVLAALVATAFVGILDVCLSASL